MDENNSNSNQNPPAQRDKDSRLKSAVGSKHRKESQNVLMSTSQGFVSGKISSRAEEREAGKKTVKVLGKNKLSLIKTSGKWYARLTLTPYVWAYKHLPANLRFQLEKFSPIKHAGKKIETLGRSRSNSSAQDYQKQWNNAVLKKTIFQRLKNIEIVSKMLRSKGYKYGKRTFFII